MFGLLVFCQTVVAQDVPQLADSAWVVQCTTRVNGNGHFQVLEWGLPTYKTVWLAGSVSVTQFPEPRHHLNAVWVDYQQPVAFFINDTQRRIEHRVLNDIGPGALTLASQSYHRVAGRDSSASVAGFPCRVYEARADMPELGGSVRIRIAIAPKLAMANDYCTDFLADTSLTERALVAGCMGYPLRREITLEGLDAVITEEATGIQRLGHNTTAPPWPVWPDGYNLVPFDPTRAVD